MAILLTGGSGFIGSHIHTQIPNQEIINLDLEQPNFNNDANYIKGDIRIKSDVIKAVEGKNIDCIISLAAKHHDFGVGHDEYFDTNQHGTEVLCQVASEFGIRKIIFYSSVAVYGSIDVMSNEEINPSPNSPYGESKLAGEKVLVDWANVDPHRQLLIIRPTVVFGKNNYANMSNLIKQIDSGFYFHVGKADNIKSIAYVENVIQATLFLMTRMKNGVSIYNYSDEPQLTSRVIGDTIAKYLCKEVKFSIPLPLALVLCWPFDLLIRLTGKNLPVSTSRLKKLATQTYHSSNKILSEGFSPRFTTIEGLEKMVEWYKSSRSPN